MKRKNFELTILLSCNEDIAGKVTDEVMEARYNFLGDGVAACFQFEQVDEATIDKISLNPIEGEEDGKSTCSNQNAATE